MSMLWFKCSTIRLPKMFYQHHCFFHFNQLTLTFAIIYLLRKPVPIKLSHFSFNLNYGQKQVAKLKWKSCQKVKKLKVSDKISDSGAYR